MSRPEDDAQASTMASGPPDTEDSQTFDRASHPPRAAEQFGEGSMVGRYRLASRLGAGAMGVVWSARDPELDRDVAIKLVHSSLHSDEAASRFRREARAMAKLSHRSVITVHDTGVAFGQLFLAMELVRGTTLGQLLRERTPVEIRDWRRWLPMLLDAGRGLAEAHRNGVLHRDFKPDNVLVDRTGRVCVGDFGLATLGDRPAARPSSPVSPITLGESMAFDLTTTGAVLGTPLYMSPQQLNAELIDERADQFAFCVALHEAMYGRRPFSTDVQGLAAIPSLIDKISHGVPLPPDGTEVPPGIHDCIVRGLAYEPGDRWPDMTTLIAALERAAKQRGTTMMKPPAIPRPVWFAIAGAAALILIVVVVLVLRGTAKPPVVAPTQSSGSSTTKPQWTKLFDIPLNTRTAVSADGRYFALAGEALEVRDLSLAGKPCMSINTLPLPHMPRYLEVDAQEVRFSDEGGVRRHRWRYREGKRTTEMSTLPGTWRGTTASGELVQTTDRKLALVKPGGELETWPVQKFDVIRISPDRERVAYIEGGRFTGTISVREAATGRVLTTPTLDEPMALAWLGPTTLIYATSTLISPQLFRVEVGTALGPPELIYEAATGWFSELGGSGKTLFVVYMTPTPRGRVLDLGTMIRRNELDSVSLGIGWDASDQMVTWSKSNHQISSHAGKLDGEPANTTRAGDTLIASIRELGGRRAVAVSLSTGAGLWRLDDKRTIAVRCAGDRAPPCFAVRYVDENLDRIVTLDPATGLLGTTPIYEARRIEDIAVRSDGQALVITRGSGLVEIKADGTPITEYPLEAEPGRVNLNLIRSVAYTKTGFVVAGTVGRNGYRVARVHDGRFEILDEARDRILSLVRPSSDDARISFLARGYDPELFQLQLP